MTSQPSSTGEGSGQDDNKMTAAKALFITFFAAALGWAGVLIAAVAVATEQTWSKGQVEGDRAKQRAGSWVDNQRAWLGQDHRNRQARAKAHKDWLDRGAPANNAPARPRRTSRLAAAIRRLVANVAVGATDFGHGLKQGWQEGNEVRRNGGGFRDIVRTAELNSRPKCPRCLAFPVVTGCDGLCIYCYDPKGDADGSATKPELRTQDPNGGTEPAPSVDDDIDVDLDGPATFVVHGKDTSTAAVLDFQNGLFGWACRDCTGRGFDFPSREAAAADCRRHVCTKSRQAAPKPASSGEAVTWECRHCGERSRRTYASQVESNDAFYRDHAICPKAGPMNRESDGKWFFRCGVCGFDSGQIYSSIHDSDAARKSHQCPQSKPEGEPMPAPADSNATVLATKLDTVKGTVTAMGDDVDTLAVITKELQEKVTRADDLAQGAGMPTVAVVAVDAIQQARQSIDAHLDDFATATAEANEQLVSAAEGLNPVNQAENKLHAAGADGRVFDTAAV